MHLELVLIGYGKEHREMTIMKKEKLYAHRSLETGGMTHRTTGGTPRSVRRQIGPSPLLWFPWEEIGKKVEAAV